jgi:hypothetical protein
LNDNKLPGAELKNLVKYKELRTLKFAGNLLKEFADLESLVRHYFRDAVILSMTIERASKPTEPRFD